MDADAANASGSGRPVKIQVGSVLLGGEMDVPADAWGIVILIHCWGSGHHRAVGGLIVKELRAAGIATLLIDLLTHEEEEVNALASRPPCNIDILADRLTGITDWLSSQRGTCSLPMGYFSAGVGTAAALTAATRRPDTVTAIVSRAGRPDLAHAALAEVRAPTLLIVGGGDLLLIELNRQAFAELRCPRDLKLLAGASHLFEEPGALDEVARLARDWFKRYLGNLQLQCGAASDPHATTVDRQASP